MAEERISFRGEKVPTVISEEHIATKDSSQVISEFLGMTNNQRSNITVNAVHYENGALASLKLSNNDIISTETAIALARANLLNGFSTGKTMRGGLTLRSKPSTSDHERKGIHELPQF